MHGYLSVSSVDAWILRAVTWKQKISSSRKCVVSYCLKLVVRSQRGPTVTIFVAYLSFVDT